MNVSKIGIYRKDLLLSFFFHVFANVVSLGFMVLVITSNLNTSTEIVLEQELFPVSVCHKGFAYALQETNVVSSICLFQ